VAGLIYTGQGKLMVQAARTPVLAKNARMGHPLLWCYQGKTDKGGPPAQSEIE